MEPLLHPPHLGSTEIHIQRKVARINRAERKFRQELEREPLIEEITSVTGFSVVELATG